MRARPTRRRVALALAAVLAASLVITGCAPDEHVEIDVPPQADAAFPEATAQQLQDAVTHAMTAAGASGAIVGVWAPWSGTLVTGVGVESPASTAPVTDDMEFRIAQVTRAMTCDVLYAVAQEGTVRINDSVAKWVPGVPDLADVTLGQLCESTSGIGSYGAQLGGMFLKNPTRVWNPRELASYGLGHERTTAPGTAYRDSDAGYVMLGVALERATGRSAADLYDDYVFDPLDLVATRLPSDAPSAPSTTAPVLKGHHSQPDAAGVMNCTEPLDVTTLSASIGYTDSGVVSNIRDLGRYAQALAAGTLVPEGADRFDEPIALGGAPSWYVAGGGVIRPGSLVGQFGSIPGYATAAFSDAGTGLTVAVVLNNSGGGRYFAERLALELAAIASKAPATDGAATPDAGLPWTAQQYHDQIAASAICAAPPA
jgi:D-alanyl-D-alanine carboxypeptidase